MIGYKIAYTEGKRVLVTLNIPDDALTNINRDGVKDIKYAKHVCNKANVVSIEDERGNGCEEAQSSNHSKKSVKYIVGEEIVECNYAKEILLISGEAFTFFLDRQVALLYGLSQVENGEYKKWFDNGQLEIHCYYENGKLQGEYTKWFMNGNLERHAFYNEGKVEGEYKRWYLNGNLYEQFYYREGELDGESKWWYTNTQLASHTFYKKGNLDGEFKWWHREDDLNKSGQIYIDAFFKDGKYEGDYKCWYSNGVLCIQSFYKKGKLDGKYQEWDRNGEMIKDEMYVNGEKIN